jgi:hypothetical protein
VEEPPERSQFSTEIFSRLNWESQHFVFFARNFHRKLFWSFDASPLHFFQSLKPNLTKICRFFKSALIKSLIALTRAAINTLWRARQRLMAAKLSRLAQKISMVRHLWYTGLLLAVLVSSRQDTPTCGNKMSITVFTSTAVGVCWARWIQATPMLFISDQYSSTPRSYKWPVSFSSLPKSCVHFCPIRATSPPPPHLILFDLICNEDYIFRISSLWISCILLLLPSC